MSTTRRSARRSFLGLALVAVLFTTACIGGGTFRTYYETPISAEVSRGWTVSDVRVSVPDGLIVSEDKAILPKADIVWREDPPGDRRARRPSRNRRRPRPDPCPCPCRPSPCPCSRSPGAGPRTRSWSRRTRCRDASDDPPGNHP